MGVLAAARDAARGFDADASLGSLFRLRADVIACGARVAQPRGAAAPFGLLTAV